MATVFMKWLETSPQDYDRGIQLLTLGRLTPLKAQIAHDYVRPGTRVLEIGCGTGTLTRLMAEQGAVVTGIDASDIMLAEAKEKIAAAGLAEQVTLQQMDASLIGDKFEPASFDLIVSTLVFSELPPDTQKFVLVACRFLLAENGRLLIADEVIPQKKLTRLLFYLIRLPLVFITWLLTRTTTFALSNFDNLLAEIGFQTKRAASHLGGTLVLYEAAVPESVPLTLAGDEDGGIATCCLPCAIQSLTKKPEEVALPPGVVGRLQHQVTWRTLLTDLWALFFRIVPPYPKVRPGLYAVGQPDEKSPVLVTGNFDLTVRRVVKAIDGRCHVWLLVADSAGINVWCAAGGGYFTAEKVITAVKSSHLSEVVKHHALILPQLAANGVDGWKIRQETGWGVHWGPAKAVDIPAYLDAHRKKTDAMRWVRFPLKDRLEMVTVTLGFYALLILLPVLIFWRHLFWPVTAVLLGLSYFYAVVHPWLPGRDGLQKSIPLMVLALAGLWGWTAVFSPMPLPQLFNWSIAIIAFSVFTGAELQGMSPLMRGEQANWGWEAIIGTVLGLIYWLAPLLIGWR
ncbi:MAG: methyltransferase domain-containing protein [Anaerolineae bacterium]